MKHLLALGIAVTALAVSPAAASAAAQQSIPTATDVPAETKRRDADKAAIDKNLAQQHAAWFNEDGAAFAATFHKDSDVVTFNGDHLSGREGIAKAMQYYFDKYIEKSRIRVLDEQPVHWVERDIAVIVRKTCFVPVAETECREDSLTRNINVYVKRDGRWLQSTFQNSRVTPLP
ncbi:hypothetical protein Aple_037060 [Acrocarpospora pleiomorpha]|uniref:Uncharacterized protein n=1 Tax=Acrocarpospora pleiomorpha TaxID=90975 RepID=A0A5M3XIN8_9ACTN|nr:SgcJ/EcaC family oxidoreductase [Acrocarpospora pleiomorpha]GES20810.1 hypothetical protein Aple_037060 [Acrocarpospora pleiomorpha]